MSPPADQRIFANGVDFLTGDYLTAPQEPEALAVLAAGEFMQTPQSERSFAAAINQAIGQPHLGFDVTELGDPAEARWGVIFAASADDRIRQALAPLISHRAARLGFQPPVFTYQPGWSAADFLAAHGVGRGFGEVDKVPYYLLIVGSPAQVPFRFQYELDPEYAVGRLDFDDAAGYADYVARLIEYESAAVVPNAREAIFWATANRGDPSTALTSQRLARPLCDGVNPARGFRTEWWGAGGGAEAGASKASLAELLSRPRPPALLFTASHGLGFGRSDPRQPAMQGALVTQEWSPGAGIGPAQIFAGADLGAAANVRGLVYFAFACYGAGTPREDDFAHGHAAARDTSLAQHGAAGSEPGPAARVIADQPFTADLPRQLLRLGALAFIGHVERAWGYSFLPPEAPSPLAGGSGPQAQVAAAAPSAPDAMNDAATTVPPGRASQPPGFARAIDRLLRGVPVAHALRDMRDRAVQLTAGLFEDLNDIDLGKLIPPESIAARWQERNDARAYIVLGDPAACLRVNDMTG